MKFGQLVVGPAGSGKSTYCSVIQEHCKTIGRNVFVANLDPAAEIFNYECSADVRNIISVGDVMGDKDLTLGPNGALVYCMEYLIQHLDWLHEQINAAEDDYWLFDCPGQIELYSHLPVMRQLADALKEWGFNICTTFLLDTTFCVDTSKFLAASLTTLSTMVALETPSVNVLTKLDILSEDERQSIYEFLEQDTSSKLPDATQHESMNPWEIKHRKLTEAISNVLDDYNLVEEYGAPFKKFVPLNADDEEAIEDVLAEIDSTIQYGENLDVKARYPDEVDPN